jgi:hypothetical protein
MSLILAPMTSFVQLFIRYEGYIEKDTNPWEYSLLLAIYIYRSLVNKLDSHILGFHKRLRSRWNVVECSGRTSKCYSSITDSCMIATPKFSETLQEIYVIHLKAKNVEEYTTLRHSFITNILFKFIVPILFKPYQQNKL